MVKKEKKKKKEKKSRKLKAGKGTIDLGYQINDDDDEFNGKETKSKADLKKEKKEKKKAEKARKKAEKKQKKLDKLKTLQAKLSKIEAAVEQYDPKVLEDTKTEDESQENDGSVPDESSANDTIEMDPEIKEIVKAKTEEISESDGFSEEPSDKLKPVAESETKEEIKKKSVSPEHSGEKDGNNSNIGATVAKVGDSSDSSSSSSSDSDDSDDSSDDDRDYKHRSRKGREAIARKETERRDAREPKAYRQDRESSYRREGTPDRFREYNRNSFGDGRKSPSFSGRRGLSPTGTGRSSGRSKSPSSRGKSRSRSPFTRRDYERRRSSPNRRSPRPQDRDGRNSRAKQSRSPPPPPPPNKTPVGNQGTGNGQNADTLLDLLRRFPVMWQGLLGLKNDTAAVQMHFLSGNIQLAEESLPRAVPPEVPPPLRISQRMKLEASQLDGVDKRIQNPKEHCMLLALPCGRDPLDVHAQTRALKTGFITYLQQKQAAGIVNINNADQQVSFVVHIFPPCEFAQAHVARVGPDLLDSAAHSGHLMILITPA